MSSLKLLFSTIQTEVVPAPKSIQIVPNSLFFAIKGKRKDGHEFVKEAIKFMNNLTIGDPMEDVTDMGPLAQESGIKTVEKQLNDALDKGAKIMHHPGPIPVGERTNVS